MTLVNGWLYLNALPLSCLSDTMFECTDAIAEFCLDASGAVTRLVLGQTEGSRRLVRKGDSLLTRFSDQAAI